MAGNTNFDRELRLKKGSIQYRLDKAKAGRSGSSAGQPRPYAKKNMAIARLYSPSIVGHSLIVSPRYNHSIFRVGKYYEWVIIEEGLGTVEGVEYEARELVEDFFIIPKGRLNENNKT